MVIGFGKQLHAARFHQFPEALDDLGRVALELVERGAGNGEAHLEAALVATDQLEQKSIHGQVALAGHLEEDAAVGVLILVKGIPPDVEKGVMPQTVGLMDLKVKANR